MITLPIPSRRAHRATFWTLLCVVPGIVTALVAWPIDRCLGLAYGAMTMLLLLLGGQLWPGFVNRVYERWNKAARWVSRGARLCVSGICFFGVVTMVRLAGSRFHANLPSTNGSGWAPRRSLPQNQYAAPFAAAAGAWGREGWVRDYIRWAKATSNLWAICLLPFLALLSALEEEEDRTFPANIYTLF